MKCVAHQYILYWSINIKRTVGAGSRLSPQEKRRVARGNIPASEHSYRTADNLCVKLSPFLRRRRSFAAVASQSEALCRWVCIVRRPAHLCPSSRRIHGRHACRFCTENAQRCVRLVPVSIHLCCSFWICRVQARPPRWAFTLVVDRRDITIEQSCVRLHPPCCLPPPTSTLPRAQLCALGLGCAHFFGRVLHKYVMRHLHLDGAVLLRQCFSLCSSVCGVKLRESLTEAAVVSASTPLSLQRRHAICALLPVLGESEGG